MKTVINGKLYDTAKMTTLCARAAYNNGNYAGDRTIRVTPGGSYAYVVESNGQDSHLDSSIEAIRKEDIARLIEGWELDETEAQALAEHDILAEA